MDGDREPARTWPDRVIDLSGLADVRNAILFVWGVAVARLHGAKPALTLAVGALSCGLGVALVLLKLALH